MSDYSNQLSDTEAHLLRDEELDTAIGGTEGYPGIPLGTHLNMSVWNRPFDYQWVLVGATGHL